MSLIDPVESRRRRQEAWKGSASALSLSFLFGLLSVAAAAVCGFALGGIVDQFRLMNINSVFGTWDSSLPFWVGGPGLTAGIVLTLICVGLYGTFNHRYTGRQTGFAGIGPLTLVLAGIAVGLWACVSMWTGPDRVGVAVDPAFHEDESWGIGAWIWYSAQWWLPGVMTLLAVLSLIGRVLGRRSNASRVQRVHDLLRDGQLVTGEVTQGPTSPTPPAGGRHFGTLTVRFRDTSGQDRWVGCDVHMSTAQIPPRGRSVPVLYDPRRPGDTHSIFVSPTGGTLPEDFVACRDAPRSRA